MSSLVLPLARVSIVCGLAAGALVLACSSSKTSDTPAAPTTSTAAAVTGTADAHCAGKPPVVVDPAACHKMEEKPDAALPDGGIAEEAEDYGPTNFNSEADDDDCKYHVKWTSTPVTENTDVTFVIVATTLKDNTPLAAATPYAEIFLDDKTPAPNTPVKTTETTPGTYEIGPVQFNKPGNWNVRFHFHDECTDTEESAHGHAAFFVKVP